MVRANAHVIGIDIGTTSTVGVLIRLPDMIVATASRPNGLSSPHPGWAEADPEEWWTNACAVLRELGDAAPIHASDLVGLCVTGMLPAVVLLDRNGRLLRPSIQQSDGRTYAEVAELSAEIDAGAFLKRTGNGVNQQLVAAKTRWLERHEPDIFGRIGTIFGSYDFVNWRLTGVRGVEQNWALEAGFVDLATHALADDLIALAHLERNAVPLKHASSAVLGKLTADAALATSLPEGLPVFGGAADHIASALAAGVVESGTALLKFGGAADIIVAADQAHPDPRLFLDYHLVPGLFAPNGCMASSGSALNWLATIIAAGEEQPHARLDRLADAIPAGSDGVLGLPYFLGEKTPIQDPLARGTFTGLSLGHTAGHLWRALLEAVAYGFRHHVDVLAEIGQAPRHFLASDGGTRSATWMQIASDVLGAPIELLDNPHGSCLGAAWVAAVASGEDVDWRDVMLLSPRRATVQPDSSNAAAYDRGYRDYRALYEALKPVFRMRAG